MSPALKEGLREAAAAAGCSINAYIVQVVAAAAGHRARFRGTAETGPAPDERLDELRALPRNDQGFPISFKERDQHRWARKAWVDMIEKRFDFGTAMRGVRHADFNCPWFYVEWEQLNGPEWPEGLEPGDHRGAA